LSSPTPSRWASIAAARHSRQPSKAEITGKQGTGNAVAKPRRDVVRSVKRRARPRPVDVLCALLAGPVSRYLVDRIEAHPNITVRVNTTITAFEGSTSLRGVRLSGPAGDAALPCVACSRSSPPSRRPNGCRVATPTNNPASPAPTHSSRSGRSASEHRACPRAGWPRQTARARQCTGLRRRGRDAHRSARVAARTSRVRP
jgi:hypothetical protein